MTTRKTFSDRLRPSPSTREACLELMMNKSSQPTIAHCPAEWDLYSGLCWEPTPAGETALLSCPDDGFLNTFQYAQRQCLHNASWYVNYTFSDKPYTNFEDCFLPHDPTAEDDLKKLVNNEVIFILKSMDEHKGVYLAIHVVSIVLLVAATILSAIGVLKLKQKNYSTYSYIALTVAAAALLVNHLVSVSVSAVDDATKVAKCRLAKSLDLLSTLVFYEFLLGYMYLCIVRISQITIRPLLFKIAVAATASLAVLVVMAELLFEMLSCPSRFCGFRMLQSPFHWLTTSPKLLLTMIHVCMGSVTVFGVIFLKHPHLSKGSELCHIRQKAVSALAVVVYNVILEILLVLIHTEAYLSYSDQPIDEYLNAFSFVTAAQGIVFSIVICFLDLGLLSMLRIYSNCAQPNTVSSERELDELETHAVSHSSSNTGTRRGIEYNAVPLTLTFSSGLGRAERVLVQ